MLRFLFCLVIVFQFSFIDITFAQETSASFDGGSIEVGSDNRVCSGATEGLLRYNSATKAMEHCNGTDWTIGAEPLSVCAGITDYNSVGDTCTDGSIYIGLNLISGVYYPTYVTDVNQSTGAQWKTSTGANDISTDSEEDGRANNTNRSGSLALFPAFQTCENLTRHGHSDWYLPSRNELGLLYARATLIGGFISDRYWSSTELSTTDGRGTQFFNGIFVTDGKTNSHSVRCVRRD